MTSVVNRQRFNLLILIGVLGLASGVAGLITTSPELSLAAGVFAMLAAMIGAAQVGPHTAAVAGCRSAG